jgi:antitoxin VapB
MRAERHVRIFKNGRSRAVRIPKEFDIFGDEAVMREEEGRLVLEPLQDRAARLRALLDEWRREGPLAPGEELAEVEDLPAEPIDF